jgi:hypothetical protein
MKAAPAEAAKAAALEDGEEENVAESDPHKLSPGFKLYVSLFNV